MKILCLTLSFLLLVTLASAQAKPKTPIVSKGQTLQKLMAGTGLPYKMVNDSLAVIPYGGANIEDYQVVVQRLAELFIIYTNLSETLPGKINDTKYKYLLQQNEHYDIVKIGLNADTNEYYLRADLYRSTTTGAIFKRVIEQVANVTNIIGGELK